MCVADPRLVSAGSFPLVAPDALWGCEALKLTYDPVHSNAGQAVRGQKLLCDPRAVKRIFTFGDWTMRYYPPAVKCKLDPPWLSPYLSEGRIQDLAMGGGGFLVKRVTSHIRAKQFRTPESESERNLTKLFHNFVKLFHNFVVTFLLRIFWKIFFMIIDLISFRYLNIIMKQSTIFVHLRYIH